MERRNLYVSNNGAREPSVTWRKNVGTKDDRESSLHGNKLIGNYNVDLSQVRNSDRNTKILLVDIQAEPSGISRVNITAPSVSSTVETRAQCSSAPSDILLNIQNSKRCCNFSFLARACGWCKKKHEESNSALRVNEAINPEVQFNPNVQRSCWFEKCSSIPRRSFVAYGIISLIIIFVIITALLYLTLYLPPENETHDQSATTYCAWSTDENLDWYVSRESWEASEPNYNLETSSHERAYVVVGHTVTTYCTDSERCREQMRSLQRNAMNAGFADIPYHFVIGGDGRAYEGRSWQVAPEKAYSCDNDCLLVSFTGDYRNCCSAPNHIPSEEQMQAFDYLLDTSRRLNRLKEDFAILPQCKVASSQSPGSNLYDAIKDCNQFDLTAGTFTGFCNFNCAGEC